MRNPRPDNTSNVPRDHTPAVRNETSDPSYPSCVDASSADFLAVSVA